MKCIVIDIRSVTDPLLDYIFIIARVELKGILDTVMADEYKEN